jgi:hypothetical protein
LIIDIIELSAVLSNVTKKHFVAHFVGQRFFCPKTKLVDCARGLQYFGMSITAMNGTANESSDRRTH